MAKVHKVTLYIVDAKGDYDFYTEKEFSEEVSYRVRERMDVMTSVESLESSDEFEWDDDLAINKTKATTEDHEAYFKKECD